MLHMGRSVENLDVAVMCVMGKTGTDLKVLAPAGVSVTFDSKTKGSDPRRRKPGVWCGARWAPPVRRVKQKRLAGSIDTDQ